MTDTHRVKTLVLSLGILFLGAAGPLEADDCFFCGITELPSRLFPRPAIRDIQKVVTPLIDIQTPAVRRNPAAKFCRRNESVVDTIVFHHSASTNTQTVHDINQAHINRYSPGDPWLMIGYHYVISAPYPGARGTASVTQGRPFNIAGAHVGSDRYMSASSATANLLRLNDGVQCGVQGQRFTIPDDRFNSRGQVKGNYTTIGVVFSGNYSPRSSSNPDGYRGRQVRYLSPAGIESAGRLACELQRRHPRLTKISWHSALQQTDCPGSIRQRIQNIKQVAARFGCTFN